MEGKIFSWDYLSFFCWFMGEPFLSCNFFFINLPLKLFNFNFMVFFPKKIFWFWILKKKNWLDRRKKYIPTWHFHSIIIQNFEEKKLFQHFANLIKIRSTHLLPIFYTSDPIKNREQVCRSNYTPAPRRGVYCFTSVCLSIRPSKLFFVTFFSATIDGRNLIIGHKLHIGMPYRGKRFWNHQIPTSCLPT